MDARKLIAPILAVAAVASPNVAFAAEAQPVVAVAPTAAIRPNLALGQTGPQVTYLQQRLTNLGYFVPIVSGRFDADTQEAVIAIQKAAGLDQSGRVDSYTWTAIEQGVVARPRTRITRGIEINLSRQLLLVVSGGKTIKTINISSGNGQSYTVAGRTYNGRTPRGTFRVYRQVNANYQSGLGLGAMYRPKFFVGGIAMHGSPSVPGYPASHGCVRMSNAAMDWIWNNGVAPIGGLVQVY